MTYILCHPGDSAGCGHHRILKPLEIFGQTGLAAGRPELQFLPSHLLKALNPDVVVWQRQCDPAQIEIMRRYRQDIPEAFFVYEVDDALSSVPDASWHKPYMPPDIDSRMATAIKLCDVVTVTTFDLAKHILAICGGDCPPVRVSPNMLSRQDLMVADTMRRQSRRPNNDRFRIGWGGGIGHAGDLAMLGKAFEFLKDRVEWVFLGMNPELPDGVASTFVGAVPPSQYMAALASLDVDLIVAPLEDNHFNACKSNLRLIEAGACGYPVIASPMAPYRENKPPVVDYANTPDEWVKRIVSFMSKPREQRAYAADKMRKWVERHYVLDDKAAWRLSHWLPTDARIHMPAQVTSDKSKVVCVSGPSSLRNALANRSANDSVVYVRSGVELPHGATTRLTDELCEGVASISVVTNDGGPAGFPGSAFTAIDRPAGALLDKLCAEVGSDQINIGAAIGPMILLSAEALGLIGDPEFSDHSPELGLIEWSAHAAARGLRNIVAGRVFVHVDAPQTYAPEIAQEVATRIGMRWPQGHTDEDRLLSLREDLEIRYHREHYRFIPPQNPTDYQSWAALVDSPGTKQALVLGMEIIRHGQPPSESATWHIVTGVGTEVPEHAADVFNAAILANPGVDVFYADHDYRMADGVRNGHDFKPNPDLHMLLSRDYMTQIMCVRGSAIPKLPWTESEWYRFALETLRDTPSKVSHVPHILAHIALPDLKDEAAMAALSERYGLVAAERIAIAAKAIPGVSVAAHPAGAGLAEVSYIPMSKPLVSIIVPTKDRVDMLGPCLATVLGLTTYPNFEVVVVSNNTSTDEMEQFLSRVDDPRVRVVEWNHPFNWSTLNNVAVRKFAKGEVLCFLNDDTRVVTPHWLTEMVGAVQLRSVGSVGAKLVYPSGQIQHVGVVVKSNVNGHYHKGAPGDYVGYNGLSVISHEATVVTGACLVVTRRVFEEAGGFDETFAHNFNDVAFGLTLRRKGYVNVVAARAELQHYEGVTRTSPMSFEGHALLQTEVKLLAEKFPEDDPYWNPNLAITPVYERGMVLGLNFDVLNWQPIWVADAPVRRVLVLGESVQPSGTAVYTLEVAGNAARISSPPMANLRPFDLRDPIRAGETLQGLGLDEIIITGLGNAPIQVLAFLARLGIPVTYRPSNAEAACPQIDCRPGGVYCNQGWRDQGCQTCVDTKGSPHGPVGMMAWLSDWMRFLSMPHVSVDTSQVTRPEHALVLQEVFMGGAV